MSKKSSFSISKLVNYQSMLLLLLFALILYFSVKEPVFLKPKVMLNVLEIIGETLIMALPMTFIIVTGGIDLSVGYNLTMSAVLMGYTYNHTGNLWLSIAVCMIAGTLGGALNGVVVAFTRIPALVCTLATMSLYRGIALIVAGSDTFTGFPDGFKAMSKIKFGGIVPIQAIYVVVLFLVFAVLFNRASLGRYLKGIGFNENAVIFAGVDTAKIKFWIYTVCGALCGFAALVYLGRLSAAKPSMGADMNLEVITAVVLGGTSTTGGVGSVTGTLIGALVIGVLKKGFTLLNFSGNIYNFFIGAILIIGLIVFAVIEEHKKTARRKG